MNSRGISFPLHTTVSVFCSFHANPPRLMPGHESSPSVRTGTWGAVREREREV
jgi:hypothetical protein